MWHPRESRRHLTFVTRSHGSPRNPASQREREVDAPDKWSQANEVIALTEQQIIDQLAKRLADAHTEVAPTDVARVVHEQYARFEGRPIRDFVPLFVERRAAAELVKLDA